MPDLLLVLIVVLIAVVLWRGPKTLPQIGAALGRGYKEARTEAGKAQAEIQARAGGSAAEGADGTGDASGAVPIAGPPTGDGQGVDRPA